LFTLCPCAFALDPSLDVSQWVQSLRGGLPNYEELHLRISYLVAAWSRSHFT
jgi:hypothetical protein